MSDVAIRARQIDSFGDLNNLDLVIKIGIDRDKTGQYDDKNRVIAIITPDHMSYSEYMNANTVLHPLIASGRYYSVFSII